MSDLISDIVEGVIRGIRGAITRKTLGDALIEAGGQFKRGEIVSDETLSKAAGTLASLRSLRKLYSTDNGGND